jgi:hypothetical protein
MTLRALTAASARGELGARAMVRLEPRVVTMYRVEWEYDGHQAVGDFDYETSCGPEIEPARRVRVKFFRNKGAAYNWMALRLIFSKRNKLATRMGDNGHPEGCRLCDALPLRGPEDQPMCRYHEHGGEEFERIRKRLARWLKWRDGRAAELATP